MNKQKFRKILAEMTVFALGITLSQNVAFAGFYISNKENELYLNLEMNPGEERTGIIEIGNTGEREEKLLLYGADAMAGGNAGFFAKSYTDKQRTVGTWISFAEPELILKKDESKQITYVVKIPEKTPPGTYAGAVAATTTINPAETAGVIGIIPIYRTVQPIYIKIPGEEIHAYEWNQFSFTSTKERSIFELNFANKGNTIVEVEGDIEIYEGDSDKIFETIKVNRTQFYAGETSTATFLFDAKKAKGIFNKYRAVAKIKFSKIDIKTNEGVESETLTKELTFEINHYEIIWYALAGFSLITLIAGIAIIRKKLMKKNAVQYMVKENETVETIAKNVGCSWKKVVELNRLKAPYSLTTGQKILIPRKR